MPRKIGILALALAAVVVAVVFLMAFLPASPPARQILPTPNGYDDFLKAGALVTGDVSNFPTLDPVSLRALVSTNAESLRLLRLGLTRECAFPQDATMTNVSGFLHDLADQKRLALTLAAEGRLREMDNQAAEAARSYVDVIQFGNEISKGGFIINRLVGIACQSIGYSPLAKLVPRLNREDTCVVAAELEKIGGAEVMWDEVRRNENRFVRYQVGRRALNPVVWIMTRWESWHSARRAETKNKGIEARMRLLTTELALRCYQSGQGRPALALDQLVPRYLQRVPLDPFNGGPMVYRTDGTNWLLYSVGEDGVDHGGRRAGRSVSGVVTKGDLFYDSP